MNTFGRIFKLTTSGESHGKAMTGILDGVPPGFLLDESALLAQLARRRPGQSAYTSPRMEEDLPEILSGIDQGKTTGQPIAFVFRNNDIRPSDYQNTSHMYRPSHADYTYEKKYGNQASSGGGRASARETVSWVFAGAIASQILSQQHIYIRSWVHGIGPITAPSGIPDTMAEIEANPIRCPDAPTAIRMQAYLESLQKNGDTCGGVVKTIIQGLPVGLGEPVFDKLHARLAAAMMGINACRAFELGEGVQMAQGRGSEYNDSFAISGGEVVTTTNHSSGIQGGISNGMPVLFQCYFKPVSSIKLPQSTIDQNGNQVEIRLDGRHDPCVVPRAVPITESLAAMVVLDFLLLQATRNI